MQTLLQGVDRISRAIILFSRFVIIATGIALTVMMTANVIARYTLESGGFSFAQELPMLIFPWFIIGGIVLAAHAGGHMAVEWLYDKLNGNARLAAFVFANAISIISFLVLAYHSFIVAEIAGVEHSPVLQLPNSIGYYALAIGAMLVSIVTVAATLRVLRFGWDRRVEVKAEEMPL
ncbi:TRAP transporter small permease [Agrobacterium larrymoorei]|uniref:TRAP transporter small permease protein n=1 Tax=Agrobacterium larrymoorei TaxID=160699 RepID=A0A4D7DW73_9HYPH|nr:TRAP transporter small permease subunit [Agrobacterium larrymoorei]QCJ00629.1 TRAP transporter small permease subunit [Agrobacterium larrymoorei]QYA10627.1 TRAP transporter small permease subunit [Agrobacterium larrymoorei]